MRARPCCVATFHSTHDAIHAERACTERGVSGRLIPLPVQINADCGLAWRMEHAERACTERGVSGRLIPLPVQINADCGLAWRMEPSERPTFERLMQDEGIDAGYVDLML